jgi:hypothetical protein
LERIEVLSGPKARFSAQGSDLAIFAALRKSHGRTPSKRVFNRRLTE